MTFPQTFNRVGTAPILTKPSAADELIWASVIRVDTLIVGGLAKYYMYASPHNPTGTGVYLYTSSSLDGPWTLHSETPIVAKEIVSGADHISSPFIIWNPDTSKFHLYFHACIGSQQETYLATSSDGHTFTLSGITPVIPVGTHPAWDDVATSYACVLKDGATWRMIYSGQGAAGGHIGYATSADGITWAKQGQRTLEGAAGEEVGMLMKVGGVYYIFESRGAVVPDIYLWSSTDLSTWTPGGGVVSPKPGAWDAAAVGYPFIIQSDVNGDYYMFYGGMELTFEEDPLVGTANIGLAKGGETPAEIFTWYDVAGTATILTDGTRYNVRPGVDGRLWPEFDFITDEQYLKAGARVNLVKVKPRTITLPLIVYGANATDLAANRRALEYAFDPMRGPGKLKVTNVDAANRYLDCYCSAWDASESYDTGDGRTFFMFVVTLMAPYPYWYGDVATRTWDVGTGWGATNVPIAGDAESYPMWVITPNAAITQIAIERNTPLPYEIILLDAMPSSTSVITIRTWPGGESIINADGVNMAGYMTSTPISTTPMSTMWTLKPGVNNITVSASSAPTSIVMTYWPSYQGV